MFDRERDHSDPHIHLYHMSLPLGMFACWLKRCSVVSVAFDHGRGAYRICSFVSLHNNRIYGGGHEKDTGRYTA